ncbi:hypothetical protein GW17_00011829, partial [Ensete ventricosum]
PSDFPTSSRNLHGRSRHECRERTPPPVRDREERGTTRATDWPHNEELGGGEDSSTGELSEYTSPWLGLRLLASLCYQISRSPLSRSSIDAEEKPTGAAFVINRRAVSADRSRHLVVAEVRLDWAERGAAKGSTEMASGGRVDLEDVPSLDLMTELLRRMKCSSKPDKRLILIGISFSFHNPL